MSAVKDAVLALFEPPTDVLEPALPAAPDVSIEIAVCPHCECPECEVWSTTEARMANCPECGAEFFPQVAESNARKAVTEIFERRQRLRRRAVNHGGITTRDIAKDKIFRLLQ